MVELVDVVSPFYKCLLENFEKDLEETARCSFSIPFHSWQKLVFA